MLLISYYIFEGSSIHEINETALSLNCPFPAALILIGPHLGLCCSTFCRASAERRTSERCQSVLADAMLERGRAEVQHQVDEIDVTDHKSLLVACQIIFMSHSVCILRAFNTLNLCNLFVMFVVLSFSLQYGAVLVRYAKYCIQMVVNRTKYGRA